MKSWRWSALLLSAWASSASQQPARLPGEPHHHLKIDNEYLRAYYVEVPPHDVTELHQHDHDYLFVTLGDSSVINAVRDRPEVHLILKDGETHFTRGNFAHIARNLADTPFRNITIELLKPQDHPQNLCAAVLTGATGTCNKTSALTRGAGGIVVAPQFETAQARLDLVYLDPETSAGPSRPERGNLSVPGKTLLVALSNAEVQVDVPGSPTKTLEGGDLLWIAAQGVASDSGKKPFAFLELTFKDGSAKP